MMDIRTARKIATDVGGHWSHDDRRKAFHRLDMSFMKTWNIGDKDLAKKIWDFFGNLGIEGKN